MFWFKPIFGSEKFCGSNQKNYWFQINCRLKKFCSKIFFWSEKIFGSKKLFGCEKIFGSKKVLGPEKTFGSQQNFRDKFLTKKIFSGQKYFVVKKHFRVKNNLGWGLTNFWAKVITPINFFSSMCGPSWSSEMRDQMI